MTKCAESVVSIALAILPLAGCVVKMPYKYETDYPGNGVGRIEKRVDVPSSPIGNVTVPVGKLFVKLPAPQRYPGRIQYQIRGNDGTLHILSSDVPFEVGSCVAFAGFADGPSRTHWSFGRVTLLEGSKGCD